MNICMLSRIMPVHESGGMQYNTLNLGKSLVKQGHMVTILTTSHPHNINKDYIKNIDGAKVYYLGGCPPGKYSKKYGEKSVSIFKRLHSECPFDLIHGQNSAALYLYLDRIPKKYNIPMVITWHGTHIDWVITSIYSDLFSFKWKRILKSFREILIHLYGLFINDMWLTRVSDAVIALDDQSINKIRFQYLVSKKKIHPIYISVDTKLFSPSNHNDVRQKYNIPKDYILLLCVGRIVYEKGFQNAILALPQIRKIFPHLHLLIIGDGPHRKELENLSKNLNVDCYVTFAGTVSRTELPQYYNASDIFVNPILHISGYNTTLVEAMSCGLPVITSEGGGTQTLIKNGENGLVIKRGSRKDLVKAIIKILSDPKFAENIRKNARKCVAEKFNIDSMTKSTIILYSKISKCSKIHKNVK